MLFRVLYWPAPSCPCSPSCSGQEERTRARCRGGNCFCSRSRLGREEQEWGLAAAKGGEGCCLGRRTRRRARCSSGCSGRAEEAEQ
ncbi:hypothetical protein PR202_gb23949 [Eleusine coracana subsp. coracana]|uniref:Uncharacterized protein n=1 Tax=Eleusine coracana subsp. coracana TaxID=191504 RepID=A0AAV5FL54_ELECO|nr:hypothetical protein PR202_gb23949 [Eleusine coracana subsp. coracana]